MNTVSFRLFSDFFDAFSVIVLHTVNNADIHTWEQANRQADGRASDKKKGKHDGDGVYAFFVSDRTRTVL